MLKGVLGLAPDYWTREILMQRRSKSKSGIKETERHGKNVWKKIWKGSGITDSFEGRVISIRDERSGAANRDSRGKKAVKNTGGNKVSGVLETLLTFRSGGSPRVGLKPRGAGKDPRLLGRERPRDD